MRLMSMIWMRLRALVSGRRLDRELDEEIRFHIDGEASDYVERGMTPAEARRKALIAFGGPAQISELSREARGWRALEGQKHKQFDDGVRQLEEEGLMQVFRKKLGRDPVVGVVGALQFDVIQSRLETEYGAGSRVEPLSYVMARWIDPPDTQVRALNGLGADVLEVLDRRGRTVLLFPSAWALKYVEGQNPLVRFVSEIDR